MKLLRFLGLTLVSASCACGELAPGAGCPRSGVQVATDYSCGGLAEISAQTGGALLGERSLAASEEESSTFRYGLFDLSALGESRQCHALDAVIMLADQEGEGQLRLEVTVRAAGGDGVPVSFSSTPDVEASFGSCDGVPRLSVVGTALAEPDVKPLLYLDARIELRSRPTLPTPMPFNADLHIVASDREDNVIELLSGFALPPRAIGE